MEKEYLKDHHNEERNELIEEEILFRHHPNTIKLLIDFNDQTAVAEAKTNDMKNTTTSPQ